jgi:hypothetical protein
METLLQVTASWVLPALFFWFVLSLGAMTIVEFLQRYTRSRQRALEEAIQKLLGSDLTARFFQHKLVNPLGTADDSAPDATRSSQGMRSRNAKRARLPWQLKWDKPAYISSSLFAKVIMDFLLPKMAVKARSKPPAKDAIVRSILENVDALEQSSREFSRVVRAMVVQADMKTESLPAFIELLDKDLAFWYDASMNQMTPIYGSRLQWWTLGVSFVIAVVANFDVIEITSRLWTTSKYIEELDLLEKLHQLQGWTPLYEQPDLNLIKTLPVGWHTELLSSEPVYWLLKGLGIYLGTYFIALGSQYAFNLTRRQYKPSQ